MKLRTLLVVSSITVATLAHAALDPRGSFGRYRSSGELELRLSPESNVDALRVFSEPSHRLLAVLADETWAHTDEGRELLTDVPKATLTTVTIHGSRIHVEGWTQAPLPASDTEVVVYARTASDAEHAVLSSHSDIHHDFTLTALR